MDVDSPWQTALAVWAPLAVDIANVHEFCIKKVEMCDNQCVDRDGSTRTWLVSHDDELHTTAESLYQFKQEFAGWHQSVSRPVMWSKTPMEGSKTDDS